jgi:hypothetical protein
MKIRWLLLIAMLGVVPARAAEPPLPAPLRLLVPAYFYPAGKGLDEWKRLARAAKDVPIVAIANPASGPGSRQDPSYTAAIDLARSAGVSVIGYVSTRYARRPAADVRADIDRWLQYYPKIDGFFFDEQASAKEGVPYYEAMAKYVQTKRPDEGALVVTNPGTGTAAEYLVPWKGIHVSCLYEDHGSLDRYQRPAWTTGVPAAQVAGLVYGEASLAKMRENVRLAAGKGVGFLYITDDGGNNPWDRLPTGNWRLPSYAAPIPAGCGWAFAPTSPRPTGPTMPFSNSSSEESSPATQTGPLPESAPSLACRSAASFGTCSTRFAI